MNNLIIRTMPLYENFDFISPNPEILTASIAESIPAQKKKATLQIRGQKVLKRDNYSIKTKTCSSMYISKVSFLSAAWQSGNLRDEFAYEPFRQAASVQGNIHSPTTIIFANPVQIFAFLINSCIERQRHP